MILLDKFSLKGLSAKLHHGYSCEGILGFFKGATVAERVRSETCKDKMYYGAGFDSRNRPWILFDV